MEVYNGFVVVIMGITCVVEERRGHGSLCNMMGGVAPRVPRFMVQLHPRCLGCMLY